MQREERPERAYGPYEHRKRWRVVVVRADGERVTGSFASFAKAQERIDEVNQEAGGRTVSAAVDEYVVHCRARNLGAGTVATIAFRLRGLLDTAGRDRWIYTVTPAIAAELFERRSVDVGGETQRKEIDTARAFAAWCIEKRWLRADPFAELAPTKPRGGRKATLRIEESRKLIDAALDETSLAGLAVAFVFMMGVRASEVTDRVVRDVDDGARILWIDRAKTRAGERHLEIPIALRVRMAELVAGRGGGEPLWGDVDRHWLARHTRRLCRAAKVPVVSPQNLRATNASIGATEVSVEHVARALGHAGTAVTRRHYLAPGAEQVGQQRAALRALAGGKQ